MNAYTVKVAMKLDKAQSIIQGAQKYIVCLHNGVMVTTKLL